MTFPAARITSTTAHGGTVTVGTPTTLIGGMPASRMGDMHVCPLVTPTPVPVPHVGGPLVLGAFNVLVSGPPQSRSLDMAICVGPPDLVAMGHPTTLVGMAGIFAGGLGGFLALVLGGFSAGARNFFGGYPRAVVDPSDPHGYYTQYSPGVRIRGTPEYQATVVRDLNTVRSTRAGRHNLDRIDSSGRTTTIRAPANQAELDRGNTCSFDPNTAYQNADGSAGSGSDSEVIYNPDRQQVGDGSEDWMTRPPDVGLHHELEHSAEAADGTMETGTSDINGQETANVETQSVGLGHNADNPGSENAYRRERGQPRRPRY